MLCDSQGWYITFTNSGTARRCTLVLERRPFLNHHPLALTVHPPPPPPIHDRTDDESELTHEDQEVVKAAIPLVMAKLKEAFTKDIKERVVEPTVQLMLGSYQQRDLSPTPLTAVPIPLAGPSAGADIDTDSITAGAVDMLLDELEGSATLSKGIHRVPPHDADEVLSMMLESAPPNTEDSTSSKSKKKASAKPKPSALAKAQAKPKAKAEGTGTKKRSLKVGSATDGPPKKRQKKAPVAQTKPKVEAEDDPVFADLMDAVAGSEGRTTVSVSSNEALNLSKVARSRETSVDWDLEAELTSGMGTQVPSHNHAAADDVDVELELLRAIGAGEDEVVPSQTSLYPHPTDGMNGSNLKRSREPSPPSTNAEVPVPPAPALDITTSGRKRVKTAVALANEELQAEYDAIIPLPPTKKKKSTKGKNGGDKDVSYHYSKSRPSGSGGGQRVSKPSGTKVTKTQPSSRLQSVAGDVDASTTQSVGAPEEASRLTIRASPPPTPPKTPIVFVKPPRPRLPTAEELSPPLAPVDRKIESIAAECEQSPSVDPISLGVALDDEELFFLKAGLARRRGEEIIPAPHPPPEPVPATSKSSQLRVHRTGSARSEGYYKIPEALKSTYLPQRNRAMVLDEPNKTRANAEAAGLTVTAPATASASSRSNRINTRRLVQGMEQANKAMGDTQSTQLQFNQLRARKKQLIFARSPIHDWGLYAMEAIPQGEMVIEYVGEVIRAQVADKREKWYERIGIGSSYLFRIDEDLVVDATKRGNLGCALPIDASELISSSFLPSVV